MATILIKPISVQSKGEYPVRITGIDPTDHDCISGSIERPGTPLREVNWNLSGIMRDGSDKCNLDMNSDELSDLATLARKLGA